MEKVKAIKRPVYRKNSGGDYFYKIFPDKSTIQVCTGNMFTDGEITKTKNPEQYNKKDINKIVARKQEFMEAHRKARKIVSAY